MVSVRLRRNAKETGAEVWIDAAAIDFADAALWDEAGRAFRATRLHMRGGETLLVDVPFADYSAWYQSAVLGVGLGGLE